MAIEQATRGVRVGNRSLTYETYGAAGGAPVLSLHGSPGSRLSNRPDIELLADAGVLLLTYDRPGYGQSKSHPYRAVADCAADVEAILDDAGVDRLPVIGRSGGGPHALALAVLLAHRCTTVTAVASLAPFDAMASAGEDWYAGMDPENVRRFRAAERGPSALRQELEPDLAAVLARGEQDPVTMWGPMAFPEADRAILQRAADRGLPGIREAARQGAAGFTEDFSAFVRPWGFDPADVEAPVRLEYGRLDVNVPAAHGDWLAARLPAGTLVSVDEKAGHMKDPDTLVDVLRELALA